VNTVASLCQELLEKALAQASKPLVTLRFQIVLLKQLLKLAVGHC